VSHTQKISSGTTINQTNTTQGTIPHSNTCRHSQHTITICTCWWEAMFVGGGSTANWHDASPHRDRPVGPADHSYRSRIRSKTHTCTHSKKIVSKQPAVRFWFALPWRDVCHTQVVGSLGVWFDWLPARPLLRNVVWSAVASLVIHAGRSDRSCAKTPTAIGFNGLLWRWVGGWVGGCVRVQIF
jgi:hypothetical protein